MLDPAQLERIGVYQDPADRQYKRDRVRNTNFAYDERDPEAERKGLLVSYDEQLVPHTVILPLATDPASVEEARLKAVATGADFYHPDHGWLRWGRKRETERPENLGAATVQYRTRKVTVAATQPPIPDPEPDVDAVDMSGAAGPEPEPEPPVARRSLKGD